MGSNTKRYKEKESSSSTRKRRHRSPSNSDECESKERRHKHKKHHRERKREIKPTNNYESDGSNIVEIIADDDETTTIRQDEQPTTSSGQSSESLSIEETNKLRAKLGLKPLEINTASNKKRETDNKNDNNKKIKDDWGEFYHRPADNIANKLQVEKLKTKIQTLKDKRQLHNKLNKVKLLNELSDNDSDIDNPEKWIEKSRKLNKEKSEAEKREKLLNELDEQFDITNIIQDKTKKNIYTEKNLKGLAVEHSVDSFKDEQTIILTLKDQNILDTNDDVLINVNLLDDERYEKSNENKKKKILYNPYSTTNDQILDEDGNIIEEKTSLLSKYDEEIDGVQKKTFKIGEQITNNNNKKLTIKEKLYQKKIDNLLTTNLIIASDYYNESEMEKFKKIKKKKMRKIRTKGKLLTADDLEELNQNINNKGIESIGKRRPKKEDASNYTIDDVDINLKTIEQIKIEDFDEKDNLLEQALNKARKLKQKENLIKNYTNYLETNNDNEEDNKNHDNNIDNSNNIILNATAEFCRTLGDIPTYGKSGNRDETDKDLIPDDVDYDKDLINDEESDESDYNSKNLNNKTNNNSGWNSIDLTENNKSNPNNSSDINKLLNDVQILDEEPDVSTGMGAALKLAMSKGYLDKEEQKRPSNSRLAHLQAKHYSIEDKTYTNDDNDRMSRRERYTGPIMEFKEKDTFKPNVKLEYIDDDGHILNSKEAFRYLSHKFHGKGPGKNKVEKRLKKSVQEQLMKKMSSTDTPLGTLNMLQAKQKETQSAFVVLSGNKQNQSTVISKSRR